MDNQEEPDDTIYDADHDAPFDMYDAFHKRTWKSLFVETAYRPVHPTLVEGYYAACLVLVKGIVDGKLEAGAEGIAATFLFRHYLELSLKYLIVVARQIDAEGHIIALDEIQEVQKIHILDELWKMVVKEVKPKVEELWAGCDIDFLEQCILEFNKVDRKSFAYRYETDEPQAYEMNFKQLLTGMDHVYFVLSELTTNFTMQYLRDIDEKTRIRMGLQGLDIGDSYLE
jgi:hypothetical protein